MEDSSNEDKFLEKKDLVPIKSQKKLMPVFIDDISHVEVNIKGQKYKMPEVLDALEKGNAEFAEKVLEELTEYVENQIAEAPNRDFKSPQKYEEIQQKLRSLPSVDNFKWEAGRPTGQKYMEVIKEMMLAMGQDFAEKEQELEMDIKSLNEDALEQLQDEIDDLDKAPLMVLLQKLFGIPSAKNKGRDVKMVEPKLHIRIFKEAVLLLGKLACVLGFKNFGKSFKVFLLNQMLARLEGLLNMLDKRGYKGPLKELLEKLRDKIKSLIQAERNDIALRKPKLKHELEDKSSKDNETANRDEASKQDEKKTEEKQSEDKKDEAKKLEELKEEAKKEQAKQEESKGMLGVFDKIGDAIQSLNPFESNKNVNSLPSEVDRGLAQVLGSDRIDTNTNSLPSHFDPRSQNPTSQIENQKENNHQHGENKGDHHSRPNWIQDGSNSQSPENSGHDHHGHHHGHGHNNHHNHGHSNNSINNNNLNPSNQVRNNKPALEDNASNLNNMKADKKINNANLYGNVQNYSVSPLNSPNESPGKNKGINLRNN
ncbi:MAG: hypothetical protein J0G32_04270 [Alphaproteobacteria bacterium]|nr:hypothetical protein [Alphaproteobacteria bacterium]OJV13844.1 MAG: hypothetical protein BGO27_08095 [Alphaproteobacteria bacterium 33-17]